MWCMQSPSVVVYLFPPLDTWGALSHVVWCLSCCFPATVAILLIGLRNLYHVYDCAQKFCVSSYVRYFVMWGLPISLWCSGRGVGSESLKPEDGFLRRPKHVVILESTE
jgi:hypothetical protein